MNTPTIQQINKRLETIPADFYQEILDYIEFLSFKTNKNIDKNLINEIQNSLHQVKQIKEGKLSKQTAKDFLNEL
jgi:hypothetical protein